MGLVGRRGVGKRPTATAADGDDGGGPQKCSIECASEPGPAHTGELGNVWLFHWEVTTRTSRGVRKQGGEMHKLLQTDRASPGWSKSWTTLPGGHQLQQEVLKKPQGRKGVLLLLLLHQIFRPRFVLYIQTLCCALLPPLASFERHMSEFGFRVVPPISSTHTPSRGSSGF